MINMKNVYKFAGGTEENYLKVRTALMRKYVP
jgi:hypothetical protein